MKIYPDNENNRNHIFTSMPHEILVEKINEMLEETFHITADNVSSYLFICWQKIGKKNKIEHIQFMMEHEGIQVANEHVNALAFRAGANGFSPTIEYLHKNNLMDELRWGNALYGVMVSSNKFNPALLKYLVNNYQFTNKTLSSMLAYTSFNQPALDIILPYVDIKNLEIVTLHEAVAKQNYRLIKTLIEDHQVDFSHLKTKAIEYRKNMLGEEILKMIETQILFNSLDKSLSRKDTSHKIKI